VLTLGDVLPVDCVTAPPNVIVRDYLPHEDLLPHTAVVVGHGGLSTITTALSYGVPMICIPQGREQPINADRVEAVGVGRSLPTGSSAETVAAAVDTVLRDSRYRTRAQAFARSIAGLGGGAVATRLVEALAD
jgi:UDP:flavonoid glycosyltransferase YjiC (YdhE family)